MEEANMMERMLQKGDRLTNRYEKFDFSNLEEDPVQSAWLSRLSLFTKYRQRIINRYNGTTITSDLKIMFMDQHSMRIGSSIFYTLESARQAYIGAAEGQMPISGILAFGFFNIFALRTPIHHKLYRELGYSLFMGGAIGYGYTYYHYMKYIDVVDQCCALVKHKFQQNPDLVDG